MTIQEPVPRYLQVANQLREAINRGDYKPGEAIPSEAKLIERYGLARPTIRQAIAVLRSEGLIDVEHGRGAFVRQRRRVMRSARNRFGRAYRETGRGAYDVEMRDMGLSGRTVLAELGPVTPPPDAAARLKLGESELALIRARQMYADDQPTQIATSYIPWSLAEGTPMAQPDTGTGGLYSRLADIGHGPVRFAEDVETRMPTPEEAEFLRIPTGQPVFYVVRTAFDHEERPVEICEHVMPSDLWALHYEWPAD